VVTPWSTKGMDWHEEQVYEGDLAEDVPSHSVAGEDAPSRDLQRGRIGNAAAHAGDTVRPDTEWRGDTGIVRAPSVDAQRRAATSFVRTT
jgi:hypothetical protein